MSCHYNFAGLKHQLQLGQGAALPSLQDAYEMNNLGICMHFRKVFRFAMFLVVIWAAFTVIASAGTVAQFGRAPLHSQLRKQ